MSLISVREPLSVLNCPFERTNIKTFLRARSMPRSLRITGRVSSETGRNGPATVIFALETPGSEELSGFDAGGRFLDLRDGLAPDKLTAEVQAHCPMAGEGRQGSCGLNRLVIGTGRALADNLVL